MDEQLDIEHLSARDAAWEKEAMRGVFLDNIFSDLIELNARGNEPLSLEIELGEKATPKQQRLRLVLFLDGILELALRELVVVGVVSQYALKTRKRTSGRVMVVKITLAPQRFYEWYYEEEFGFKRVGTFLAFHRRLAKKLKSATAAIYYLQIYDWYQDEKKDTEGYITKTREEIRKATGLTLSEVVSSKKLLKNKDWLDVWEGNRHGIKVNRFKPLKRITMSKKKADALQRRSFERSEKISELDGVLRGLEMGFDHFIDTLDDMVAWRLRRYATNLQTLVLPPIDDSKKLERAKEVDQVRGVKKLTWSRDADQIIATDEFAQYHGDVDAAERDYEICRKMHFESAELVKKIKELRKDALAFLKATK